MARKRKVAGAKRAAKTETKVDEVPTPRQTQQPQSDFHYESDSETDEEYHEVMKELSTQAELKTVDFSGDHGFAYNLIRLAIVATIAHCIFWWMGVAVAGYLLVLYGPLGIVLVVLSLMLYMPSFLSPAQYYVGKSWPAIRQSAFWRPILNYFSVEMVRTKKLDPATQFVFAHHPGTACNMSRIAQCGGGWEKLFPGVVTRSQFSTLLFYIPGVRELALWTGGVDCGLATAMRVLYQGGSVVVYPGGMEEVVSQQTGSARTTTVVITLDYVRLAIQNGASLVPTFVFGEKFMYSHLSAPKRVALVMWRLFRLPLVAFWGWLCTCIPRRHKLGIVYGAPLETKLNEHPTEAEVRALAHKYAMAVRNLFDNHKRKFGYSTSEKLVVVLPPAPETPATATTGSSSSSSSTSVSSS